MKELYPPKNYLSDPIPAVYLGTKVVVLSQWQYVKWLAVTQTVATELRSSGRSVEILDISQYVFPKVGSPQNTLAIFLKVKPKIQKLFEGQNLTYIAKHRKGPSTAVEISKERRDLILKDVEAQAKSFFKDTDPNTNAKFYKRYVRKNLERAIRLYLMISGYFINEKITHCVIPNGRYASQKAARYAAEDLKIETSYIEVGTPNSFYWESFTVHDRVASQQKGLKFFNRDMKTLWEKEYNRWIAPRMIRGSSVNDFTRHWADSQSTELISLKKGRTLNVFFTSSRDEFEALGKDWHLDSWSDQFEAFNEIIESLTKQEPNCLNILRVHPNLLNKSGRHQESEQKRIGWLKGKQPNLMVIPPEGNVNSYDLVEMADRVFVANSTIGMEANSFGKPVWTTAATYFDEVADIRKIWSPADVTTSNLQIWTVNPEPAQKFIAYLALRERPLNCTYEDFHQIDPQIWPLRKRSTFLPSEISIGQVAYWLKRKL